MESQSLWRGEDSRLPLMFRHGDEEFAIRDDADLIAILEWYAQQKLRVLTLWPPTGELLFVGIGEQLGNIYYVPNPDQSHRSFFARPTERVAHEPVWFVHEGEGSECPAECVMSASLLIEVMRHYYKSGEFPSSVEID